MHFFEVYKTLEHKVTTVREVCGREEAVRVIARSIESYQKIFGQNKAGQKDKRKKEG